MAFDLMSWLSGKPTQVNAADGGIAGQWGDGENSFMKKIMGLLNQNSNLNDSAGQAALAGPPPLQGQPSAMPASAPAGGGMNPQMKAFLTGQPAHPYGVEKPRGEAHSMWKQAFGTEMAPSKVKYQEKTQNGGTWTYEMNPLDAYLKHKRAMDEKKYKTQ